MQVPHEPQRLLLDDRQRRRELPLPAAPVGGAGRGQVVHRVQPDAGPAADPRIEIPRHGEVEDDERPAAALPLHLGEQRLGDHRLGGGRRAHDHVGRGELRRQFGEVARPGGELDGPRGGAIDDRHVPGAPRHDLIVHVRRSSPHPCRFLPRFPPAFGAQMLRNLSRRSRSLLASLVGRTAASGCRRSARSLSRRPIGAEQLESRAMLAGVAIDGGLSWTGGRAAGSRTPARSTAPVVWLTATYTRSTRPRSRSMPRATRSWATPFRPSPPAPSGFECGRSVSTPFGPLEVSAGAFKDGNTILGIGVRVERIGSIVGFKPTVRFDIDNDSYDVKVNLDNDVVFSDPNVVNGTGTSGSTKMLAAVPVGDQNIVFQNHWDSGVKFKNVRLA